MKFDLNSWEEIFITLSRNKSRSLLTAFGVFWGIFMLLVLIGLGGGLKQSMAANFEGANENASFMMSRRTSLAYKGFQKGRRWSLDNSDVYRLKGIEGVSIVCPVLTQWGVTVVYQDRKSNVSMMGTEPSYNQIQAQSLLYGRYINSIDVAEKRKVCLIGIQVYRDLFQPNENPLGKQIKVGSAYFQIVGVVDGGRGQISFAGNPEQLVTLPFSTMQMLYNRGSNIDVLALAGSKEKSMTQLQEVIELNIKENHLISPKDPQALFFFNTEAMFTMTAGLFSGINILIWLVGLGTLFAGIIGVSNIMMVTVKERTTEFGIRRAIGALPQDILSQVMLESVVITIISGTVGLFFSVAILSGVEQVANMGSEHFISYQVSFGVAIGTLLTLGFLGLLAGLFPAYRALAIKPIDAIREE